MSDSGSNHPWSTPQNGTTATKLRPKQAAPYLGVANSTLAKWRLRGEGPRFEKCGPRIVYYYKRDLDAWLEGRLRQSTRSHKPDGAR